MNIPFDNRMLTSMLAMMRIAPPYIADFDSASGMLRATAAYLRGEDFPGVGIAPPVTEPLIALVNQLPRSLFVTQRRDNLSRRMPTHLPDNSG